MSHSESPEFFHPRFTVIGKIGNGGHTVVYEGAPIEPGLSDRRVALKVLQDPEHLDWFLRIGRITASLSHPGIVACHEVGEFEHRAFIALEFIAGLDIPESWWLSPESNWPARDVMQTVSEVAAALDHAHALGHVHGLANPNHILFTPDRRPHLIGFGEWPPPTVMIGNPIFLAPEQWDLSTAIPQTDVYGLSETAFWMLTGGYPFQSAGIMELSEAKKTSKCQNFRKLRADLPRAVGDVLNRGMAAKPDERFQSAGEFAAALSTALESRASLTQRICSLFTAR